MGGTVYTVEQWESQSIAERDAIFQASVVTDLAKVPPSHWARLQEEFGSYVASREIEIDD